MSAPELREAASLMRERAEAATEGSWRIWPDLRVDGKAAIETTWAYEGDDETQLITDWCDTPDAEHMASWHPTVALAVATWLDSEADRLAELTHAIPNVVVSDGVLREWGFGHALDVARAYLGGAA